MWYENREKNTEWQDLHRRAGGVGGEVLATTVSWVKERVQTGKTVKNLLIAGNMILWEYNSRE